MGALKRLEILYDLSVQVIDSETVLVHGDPQVFRVGLKLLSSWVVTPEEDPLCFSLGM